jgi:hypothetical protein
MTSDEELKLERAVNRGMQADAVLSNPVYNEAMVHIRGELMLAFERTKFKDSADRDEIWRKLQTIAWFERYIAGVMKDGDFAKKTLAQRIKESTHKMFKRA